MTNTLNTPIEALEAYLPLRFEGYTLRADSGGPGRWRGGCGIERSWTLRSPKATLSILAERTKIPPWGLHSGLSASLGEYELVRRDGSVERLPPKCTIPMKQGDRLVIRTPGGGGYGSPLERPPDLVLEDVVNGLVSHEAAEKHYGVVIDRSKMQISPRATDRLRRERLSGRVLFGMGNVKPGEEI
jgi:N-methylhydantoinase B